MDHGIYIFLSLSLLNFVVSHARSILLLYSYEYTIVYYFYFSYYYLVLNFASMSRQYINNPNCFGYICGEFTPKSQLCNMTPLVKKSYEKYFVCMIGDQDKSWTPHFTRATCAIYLRNWLNGSRKSMPFAVPMIWRVHKYHITDCYFCITDISGFSANNKQTKIYPNLASGMRPVNHTDSIEIPKP